MFYSSSFFVLDGFLDSDGSVKYKGRQYSNTSKQLIENIILICYLAKGYWPSASRVRNKNLSGGLKNCNEENCKISYSIYHSDNYEKHTDNNDYYVFPPLEFIDRGRVEDVYDIEVECDSHSFIANNCIVHNSACRTFPETSFGSPMFSAALEAGKWAQVPVILDGNIKQNGDIARAMIGFMANQGRDGWGCKNDVKYRFVIDMSTLTCSFSSLG